MKFDDLIIKEFETLDSSKFTVSYLPPVIFLCGGEVDIREKTPLSVRHWLIQYFNKHDSKISSACIQAEDFTDYFKGDTYSDLLEFETDIANIATLIVICLESPGALVELGLFCVDSIRTNRLLVIAPLSEVKKEDSFIFLGPLANLKRRDPDSVICYPWPIKEEQVYEHVDFMADDIKARLDKMHKSEDFKEENSAHIAFLIYDIILLSNPIMLTEIELALLAFKIEIERKVVTRLLYLLEKIKLVSHVVYSHVTYYYDVSDGNRRIKFGADINRKIKDTPAIKMAFKKSYVLAEDEQARKRVQVLKQIQQIKAGK